MLLLALLVTSSVLAAFDPNSTADNAAGDPTSTTTETLPEETTTETNLLLNVTRDPGIVDRFIINAPIKSCPPGENLDAQGNCRQVFA